MFIAKRKKQNAVYVALRMNDRRSFRRVSDLSSKTSKHNTDVYEQLFFYLFNFFFRLKIFCTKHLCEETSNGTRETK